MKRAQLAQLLHGMQLSDPIPKTIVEKAKAHGLVIVHGASDDLVEFRGAISDEAGRYEGGTVYFDAKGALPEYEDMDSDNEAETRDYFDRKRLAVSLEAHWNSGGPYSWTYSTAIPHSTFDMLDEGAPFCKGIVFSLADAGLHVDG